jgi:hypothetical protein
MLINIQIESRKDASRFDGASAIAAFLDVHDACEVESLRRRHGEPNGFEYEVVITVRADEFTVELSNLIGELVRSHMPHASYKIDA